MHDHTSSHEVPGTSGWAYGPFEHDEDDGGRTVTLVHSSGYETSFTVPEFVSQGEDIGDVARVVIRAWERREATKGLGA